MLAIRMQRTGRSGHAQFRVIVQDSRFSPKRGRVVSYLGNYDPHTKTAVIDSEKAAQYLQNGAQPSGRVARLFKKEGIKLPDWVKLDEPRKRTVRNPEKRRSTAPAQPAAPEAETQTPVAADEKTPAAEEAAPEPGPKTDEAPQETTPEKPEKTQDEESSAEPADDQSKETSAAEQASPAEPEKAGENSSDG